MSDQVLLAIIAIVPSTVAAYFGYGNKVRGEAAAGKLDQIHELTNSNLTAVKLALADTGAELKAVKDELAAYKERVDVLEKYIDQKANPDAK